MSDTTHNGDAQIHLGEASAALAAVDASLDTSENEATEIEAVDAHTTRPHDESVQMLDEQPNPNEPLRAVDAQDEAAMADAVIILRNNQNGMSFGVRIPQEAADPLNNPVHFFAEYLSKNLPWLLEQSMTEFNLRQQLAQAEDRQKLRLVDTTGRPMER